jgi:hypothetical protein
MAAQFFTAVDAELAGVSAAPAAPPPQVFTGREGVPAGTSGDLRTLALGAVGGSLLTLIGVLVGYRLGRR